MRGDIVYRVYGVHEGREKDVYFGAFSTSAEAEAKIAELKAKEMRGQNWAEQHHSKGFAIREMTVDTDFEIPSRPKPRDKYAVEISLKQNQPGTWHSTIVKVLRRTSSSADVEEICEYERNYSMMQTFEPFRQGTSEFALISRDYTRTAVLDLASGAVIAEEPDTPDGFCPVCFYVPDWWDVNDGSVIPGSEYWNYDREWPKGDFGFVWGCLWGDDSSWKVQYLDLSQIDDGVIRREERFGYLELATHSFQNPCSTLDPQTLHESDPPSFIRLVRCKGSTFVTFSVEMQFHLESGKSEEWKRLAISHLE